MRGERQTTCFVRSNDLRNRRLHDRRGLHLLSERYRAGYACCVRWEVPDRKVNKKSRSVTASIQSSVRCCNSNQCG